MAVVLSAGGLASAQATDQQKPPVSDEEFIKSLGERYTAGPLDRARLARLLYGVSATLEGGANTLLFLQSRAASHDPSVIGSGSALDRQHAMYTEELERFRSSSSTLLDDADSPLQLYRVMMDGSRSCWRLEQYVGLLERNGVGARDLVSVRSSTEACARFRQALFQPRVEGIVMEALANEGYHRSETQRLREELAEVRQQLEQARELNGQE